MSLKYQRIEKEILFTQYKMRNKFFTQYFCTRIPLQILLYSHSLTPFQILQDIFPIYGKFNYNKIQRNNNELLFII